MTVTPPASRGKTAAQDFYRTRRQALKGLREWTTFHEIGPEHKLLREILSSCSPHHPWAWMVLKDQEHAAEQLGLSVRTFKRHLAALRSRGLLLEGRTVVRGQEVPTFTIAPDALSELVSVSAKMALTGVPKWHLQDRPDEARNAQIAGSMGQNPNSLILGNRREVLRTSLLEDTQLPVGSRRLRRRVHRTGEGSSMKRVANLGADPDAPAPISIRRGVPSTRVAAHFEREWDQVLRKVPGDVRMSLPNKPWPMSSKTWFLRWVKETLLPVVVDDAEACGIISRYCTAVVERRVPRPTSDQPVFIHMARHIEKFKAAPASTTSDTSWANRAPVRVAGGWRERVAR